MSKLYDITEVLEMVRETSKNTKISDLITWQKEYSITPHGQSRAYSVSDVLKFTAIASMKEALKINV